MALSAGTRLGPYEILAALGAGGMGEVYRARDSKLNRDVAIKVLLPAVANDPDRLARFSREAQVLASLNHPNIGTIYGLEDGGDIRALVMELVEGPTLTDRLAQGAIPLDEALPIAKQIAEALEAAHEQGIIHRDLKPANIKVRKDGAVKVLDFGLAKAMDPVGSNPTMSPTLTAATLHGVILGTAAYMAPEQARGKTVDRRADIWAFGCVLFEMLAARQTFAGDSVTDLLSSVTRDEPDWSALPADTPPFVRTLLRRCLLKDPRKRLPHIGIARIEIDEGSSGAPRPEGSGVTLGVGPARRGSIWPWLLTAALTMVLGVSVWRWAPWRPSEKLPAMRFVIPVSGKGLAPTTMDRLLAISGDGTRIAFITGDTIGGGQLMIRSIGQLDAVPVRELSHARQPFFSPDGRWIAFFEGVGSSELKKIAVEGGTPITICRLTTAPRGASWGADDTIIFASADPSTGLFSVPAAGGEPTLLTKADAGQGEVDHILPSFLPDGRSVLFTIMRNERSAAVAVLNRATGHYKTIVEGGRDGQYLPPGFLAYTSDGALRVARFDPSRQVTTGDGSTVDEHILTATASGVGEYSVSRTGTLVYVGGTTTMNSIGDVGRVLVWVDRQGREQPLPAPPRAYWVPRLSPDGSRLALEIRDQEQDIWIWDLAREVLTRLTSSPLFDQAPVWSPDNKYIFYSSLRSGSILNVHRQRADGTGAAERVFQSASVQFPTSITPDGLQLVVTEARASAAAVNDINLLALTGTPRVEPLVRTTSIEMGGVLSPDGRWLANTTVDTTPDVYVRPFPNVNDGRWQVSSGGGSQPTWTRNGRELIYRTGPAMMSVPVDTSPGFRPGKAVKLFDADYLNSGGPVGNYDVSPDGQRFVMIKNVGTQNQAAVANLFVVVNWNAVLESRLPKK